MPRPQETAVLIVKGMEFKDWTSVQVALRWREGYDIFQFTCAERIPVAQKRALMQFQPGDTCTVRLAGQLAVTGMITQRVVHYDGHRHTVTLIGKSESWWAVKSSVDPKKANFDNQGFSAIARSVLGQVSVRYATKGSIIEKPFENVQAWQGEKIWDFLERLAKLRKVVLSSKNTGELLAVGDYTPQLMDTLEEGKNIFRMDCAMVNEWVYLEYVSTAQVHGKDDRRFTKASEIQVRSKGNDNRMSRLVVPVEQPGDEKDVKIHNDTLRRDHNGTEIQAKVRVHGWLTKGEQLWIPGESVTVISPMAMLNESLSIQTATFSQSNEEGSVTDLDLVLPDFLGGRGSGLGAANPPATPPASTTSA